MKKLFTKFRPYLIIISIVSFFYLPGILEGRIAIPADSLIGLYHPWRDEQFGGFNQEKYPVKNPLTTDPVLQTYPWRKLVIDNFKSFNLPLWNPYTFSGQPLLANMQSSALQFINIVFFPLPFDLAWNFQIIISSVAAALFIFIFLRSLNLSVFSSTYGAIIFPFSGFMVAWLTWGTVTMAGALLPLILFCINKLTKTKINPTHFLLLTFGIVSLFFSGHIQTAIYIIFAAFLYSIYNSIQQKTCRPLALVTVSIAVAMLISSIQLLPTLEFHGLSNRESDQLYFEGKNDWFIPTQHLIQLVAPDFFGNPTKANYWGIWNYGEFISFIGIIPLIFAVFTILSKEKRAIFFLALAFVGLSIGLKNPISLLPFTLKTPILASMQPSRIILLLDFSLIVLSAIGLDIFIRTINIKKLIKASLIVLLILLAVSIVTVFAGDNFSSESQVVAKTVALRNLVIPLSSVLVFITLAVSAFVTNKKKILTISIFLITIGELFYFAAKFIPFSEKDIVFPETKITSYLQSKEKPFRIMSTDRRIANPNSLIPYKLESVGGYDPLYLKKYAQLASAWDINSYEGNLNFNRFVTPQNYSSKITDLMNVKYILSFDEISSARFEKLLENGQTKLYLNRDALPRAFFVAEVKKENEDDILQLLINSSTNSEFAYSSTFEFAGGDRNATAEVVEYNDQSIKISTKAEKTTPLVISNINYPGWRAYLDGNEQEIENVNFILQSVLIPKGDHSIEFIFKPKIFYTSLYISASGIILMFIIYGFLWKKSQ